MPNPAEQSGEVSFRGGETLKEHAHEELERRKVTEEGELQKEAAYRSVMRQIREDAGMLRSLVEGSNYEKLPDDSALDPVLKNIQKANELFPENHPLRRQFGAEEEMALKVVEDIKNARAYNRALKTAEKDVRELSMTLESKESLSRMMADAGELGTQAQEKTEDELKRAYEKVMNPIFHTLPPDHPLRVKNAEKEQELRKVFEQAMQRGAQGESREPLSGETLRGLKEQDASKTMPDIGPPPPPPGTFDPAAELVPDELKDEHAAPVPPKAPEPEAGAREYEQKMTSIENAVDALEKEFSEAAERGDLDAVETAMGQTMNLSYDLQALRNNKPTAVGDERGRELERNIAELGVRIEKAARNIRERGVSASANAAWLPRVPRAPYRMRYTNAGRRGGKATLAAAPAPSTGPASLPVTADIKARPMPSVPENIGKMSDDEKLAYLEELLSAFKSEHARLIDEHNQLVKKLTEQVKERKLQTLRDSLKS